MKIRYVFILSFIFLLTGCHHQPDEIYLVKHPEKLKIKIENCRTLGDVELKIPIACLLKMFFNRESVLWSAHPKPDHFWSTDFAKADGAGKNRRATCRKSNG